MATRTWAVWAVLVLPAAGAADDAVAIKLKKPAAGDVVRQSKTDGSTEVTTISAGGQTQKQEDQSSTTVAFTDEVLKADGTATKPIKVRRTYEKAEAVRKGRPTDLGLKGKTVLIEKPEGKARYEFTTDGKPVSKEAADLLDREYNRSGMAAFEDVMLPAKPVKVNDPWAVDAAEIAKLFADTMKVDAAKTKVSGTLVKVYDAGGAKFGVIEFSISLAVTGMKSPMGDLDAAAGSVMTFTVTMDRCIDGSRYGYTSSGTVKGELGVKLPQADVKVAIDGTMQAKVEAAKK